LLSSYRAIHSGPSTVKLGRLGASQGLEASQVQGRWLDTARMGKVFTVTGQLDNRGHERAPLGGVLQVALLDSKGQRLDQPAVAAGLALESQRVREMSPEKFAALRERSIEALSRASLVPGDRIDFSATFAALPAAAMRFELELAQLGEAPPPVVVDAEMTDEVVDTPESPGSRGLEAGASRVF
jgi:hypothetical protein